MADPDLYFGADAPPPFQNFMGSGAPPDPVSNYAPKPEPVDPMASIAESMKGSRERLDKLEEERRETVGPMQADYLKSLQQPMAQAPMGRKVPPAPTQNIQQDLNDFVGTALIMGALGGAFTRRHATAALNTFAGAMEGRKQGLTDDFKMRIEQWQKQVEEIKTNNAEELARYKAVFTNQQTSIEQKRAQLQLVASEFQNRAMYESARQSDLVHAAQVYQQLTAQQQRMTDSKARLDETIRHHLEQEKQKAEVPLSPEDQATADSIARRYIKMGPRALTNIGRGAQRGNFMKAIQASIARQMDEQGLTEDMLSVMWAENEGVRASERTLGTRAATFGMAQREAENVIAIAKDTIARVTRTGMIPANRALVAYYTQTGSIEEVELGSALNSVINTYARAISPTGSPTVADKEHAREVISTTQTAQQMNAVLDMFKREIAAAGKAPGQVKEELRGLYGGRAAALPAEEGEWKDLGNGVRVRVR